MSKNTSSKPIYETPVAIPLGDLSKVTGVSAACHSGAQAQGSCHYGTSAGASCHTGGAASHASCHSGNYPGSTCNTGTSPQP